MTLGPRMAAMLLAMASVTLAVGCGHSEGKASNSTITLGAAGEIPESPATTAAPSEVVPVSANGTAIVATESSKSPDVKPSAPIEVAAAPTTAVTDETRTFKVEGPENSIRVSFDDFDLLKVMNLDPVPADAPERLPKWLKELDGKRIRVRGFMFPPFQDTDIRGFVLARDNQICCFGRTPKEYDLVETFLRKGVTTHYIQNRPFDVVGVFRIKSEIEKYTAMYELEDAVVIEK